MISYERLEQLAVTNSYVIPISEIQNMAVELQKRRAAMREMVNDLTEIDGSNNPERIQRYARAALAKAKEIER